MSEASERLKAKVAENGAVVVDKPKAKLSKLSTKEKSELIDQLLKDLGYAE